jgi:hypothetical protein
MHGFATDTRTPPPRVLPGIAASGVRHERESPGPADRTWPRPRGRYPRFRHGGLRRFIPFPPIGIHVMVPAERATNFG